MIDYATYSALKRIRFAMRQVSDFVQSDPGEMTVSPEELANEPWAGLANRGLIESHDEGAYVTLSDAGRAALTERDDA